MFDFFFLFFFLREREKEAYGQKGVVSQKKFKIQKKSQTGNWFRFGSGSQTATFGVVGGGGEKRGEEAAQHSTAGFFLSLSLFLSLLGR
jgi:hypothetical protein